MQPVLVDGRKFAAQAAVQIFNDLRVAAQICDRIVVMQRGRVVETGFTREVFAAPQHAYTQALFAAAGLRIAATEDVMCTYAYPDTATAIAALSSAGPVARVIEHAGPDAVRESIAAYLAVHVGPDGGYAIRQPFRYSLSAPVTLISAASNRAA